ncbi:MAG: hypothetical protein H3Z52_14595 [archaeon]|nr:hypothetical protein [archaeon]
MEKLSLSGKDKASLISRLSLAEMQVKFNAHITIDAKDLTAILPALGIKEHY